MGFFPVDHVTLQYLQLTGRSDETVSINFFWYLPKLALVMSTASSKNMQVFSEIACLSSY